MKRGFRPNTAENLCQGLLGQINCPLSGTHRVKQADLDGHRMQGAETVADGFETRQADGRLADEKGRGQSSGDEKGEGVPIGQGQTTWLFMQCMGHRQYLQVCYLIRA